MKWIGRPLVPFLFISLSTELSQPSQKGKDFAIISKRRDIQCVDNSMCPTWNICNAENKNCQCGEAHGDIVHCDAGNLISVVNARRACARGVNLQYLLCEWSLYNKVDQPVCFSPVFLDFQLMDLSKMPSFQRKSTFHCYFVVYNPCKWLCILLVVCQSRGASQPFCPYTN